MLQADLWLFLMRPWDCLETQKSELQYTLMYESLGMEPRLHSKRKLGMVGDYLIQDGRLDSIQSLGSK